MKNFFAAERKTFYRDWIQNLRNKQQKLIGCANDYFDWINHFLNKILHSSGILATAKTSQSKKYFLIEQVKSLVKRREMARLSKPTL